MINVEVQRLSLDSYAQGPLGAGSWMELVDPPLPGPNSGTLPPFTELEGNWGSNNQIHSDESFEYDFSSFYDDDEDESLSNCECGGPPPPLFNIPPPPPLPSPQENFPTEKPMEVLYKGDSNHIEGKSQDFTHQNKLEFSPSKDSYFWDCKDSPASPEDACPALLIAGDAHVRPRLQPPVAALLVAAVTFAFVIAIAAAVCWRFRKHRNRPGSTKSTSDLTNGVIYDDLPSGPTPRGLTTHGHDTCTLAPMELLDLKLASPLQTSTFEVQNRDPCHLIFSPNPLIPPTTTVTLDSNSQIVKNYPMFASPYDMDSPTKLQRANFSLYSKNSNCTDYLYNNQKPCNAEVSNYSPGNYKEYHDFLRSGYSEPATRTAPVKGSQDLYNPTYEEISSGSETTSVSSESSSRKKSIPSPQTLASPTKKIPGSWSPTPCPCVVKNNSSLRKGSRNRCNKYNSHNVCGSSYLADEYSDESSTHLYAAVPAPIPPPSLYTIPGTSDGRTSTSSSSDQPPERGREPRYYVGGNLSSMSPATPTESYSSSHNSTPHLHEKLPPLPSRSDRYRIFFTTDRKRAFQNRTQPDTKTLDLASRKRNKNKNFSASHESEPLYHEL